VVNVIDYAYPIDTEGDITINMMSDGQTLRFQIIDAGVAFDPTAKQKADTTLSVEDRQIGGLGILLVRELMDSINYERTDGKNILTLMKKYK
jgi:sigma-B regulation protein RsbU (phosphoserine phosphatase)